MKRWMSALGAMVALVATGLLVQPGAHAADPSSGSLVADGDAVAWSGGPFYVPNQVACTSSVDPTCDTFILNIGDPGGPFSVSIDLAASSDSDSYALSVHNPRGGEAAKANGFDGQAHLRFENPEPGAYEVRVRPVFVQPGSRYTAVATLATDDSGGATDQRAVIDFEEGLPGSYGCLEAVPAFVGLPGVGERITLDVLVLLDGISQAQAESFVDLAQRYSYSPLGVDLSATYETVSFPDDGSRFDSFVTDAERATINYEDLFAYTKAHVGGVRPPGIDVVYAATDKDIWTPDSTDAAVRDYGVMGVADCIGGVRYDDRSFVIGEALDNNNLSLFGTGAATLYRDLAAKVFAHEVGHIMGAHHHYGQCGPQALNERTISAREAAPCTLMAPFADIISLTMGPVEQAVVRGHADEHAH